jgi:hypothetical protein
MKPFFILFCFITASTTVAVAQSHTRDVLFPHFAEDQAKLKTKEEKADHSAPKQARSTKETIFKEYTPQSAAKARPKAAASRKAGAKLPSDVNGQTAAQENAKTTTVPAAITIPSQGDEPKLSAPAAAKTVKKN